MATEITEMILREIQHQLKASLDNAQRDRELAHRAGARVDQFEKRFETMAADIRDRFDIMAGDIRIIRSDIASIDIKLAVLGNIEADIRSLKPE